MAGSSIGGGLATVTFSSAETLATATKIADTIANGLASGAFVPVVYPGSGNAMPPAPTGKTGVAIFATSTPQPVSLGPSEPFVVVNADGPVSITGGAAGGTLLAGAGLPGAVRNLTYTDITPSGDQTATIVVTDGNNLVQTAAAGPGHYDVTTGSGDDTVTILSGNATIDAGTGVNRITLDTGNDLVTSVGDDSIVGAAAGGGTDTVDVTSGNTSIDGGSSSFWIMDTALNPLHVALGTGVDTVGIAAGGAATIAGAGTTGVIQGAATVVGTAQAASALLFLDGGASTVTAGAAADTIRAGAGTAWIAAGTGNDTLLAGVGSDTLVGGIGGDAAAALVSGSGLGTTFAFIAGQSGGADTVIGFKPTDVLSFSGYGPGAQETAVHMGSSTVITLWDGTTVTIVGATPEAHQIIVK